jgi:hypothetical protein
VKGFIGWGSNLEWYDRKLAALATYWDRVLQAGSTEMLFCREAAYLNQSLNQTGEIMRFCVKVSAGEKARCPAGYLNRSVQKIGIDTIHSG